MSKHPGVLFSWIDLADAAVQNSLTAMEWGDSFENYIDLTWVNMSVVDFHAFSKYEDACKFLHFGNATFSILEMQLSPN